MTVWDQSREKVALMDSYPPRWPDALVAWIKGNQPLPWKTNHPIAMRAGKPTLVQFYGEWVCAIPSPRIAGPRLYDAVGIGTTPRQAYRQWAHFVVGTAP